MEWKEYQRGPRAGQPRTQQDRVIRYLVAGLGYKELPSPVRRYRKFVKGTYTKWVGKKGGVRAGKTFSNSVSITDSIRISIRMWEHKEGLR